MLDVKDPPPQASQQAHPGHAPGHRHSPANAGTNGRGGQTRASRRFHPSPTERASEPAFLENIKKDPCRACVAGVDKWLATFSRYRKPTQGLLQAFRIPVTVTTAPNKAPDHPHPMEAAERGHAKPRTERGTVCKDAPKA
mmetsp:Transcript_2130/g.13940  ORF Transcript_2130/g.13940 Transcript_2130/m.13940 type:complete len:140 (+) Transcript_2130:810-1229(+)